MAPQIPHDPPGVTLQLFQRLAHAFELFRMVVAAHLQHQPRSESGIGLPLLLPGLPCQSNQLCPCPLVKPGVGGIGDVLFHHRGIDRDALARVGCAVDI